MQTQIIKINEAEEYYFDEGCFILELSKSSTDPDVSIARARVESGMTTKLHRLNGVIERYIILSGEGEVEVGGQDLQHLSAGDVVIIPSLCSQRITNSGDVDLIFLAVCTPRFTKNVYENME